MNDMSRTPHLPDLASADASQHASVRRMAEMVSAQTNALDALFARLIGEAEVNLTEWPVAAETYARLAFRGQGNCRASLEAVSRADYRAALLRKGDGL